MSDPCARASVQYAKGDITRALSNINRCQKDLEKTLKKNKQAELIPQIRLQLARAYRFEGQIYFGQQNTGKAHTAFTQALKSVKMAGTSTEVIGLRGQISYALAIIALVRNQATPAFDLLESCKSDFLAAKMGNEALEVMLRQGTLNRDLGNLPQALIHFKEVQKHKKQATDKTQGRIFDGRAKLEEARILHLNNQPSEKLLKSAAKEFSKAKFPEGQAQVLLARATLHEDSPDTYREYLFEAMELGKTHDMPGIAGIALTQLGVSNLKGGEFEKGKQQLLEGLKYRTDAGDTVGTAQTLVELARITLITSRNDKDLQTAITFAQQAQDLYRGLDHQPGMASTLELSGSIHTRMGELKSAKQEIQEAKTLYARFKDTQGEARSLTQLGLIYDQENRSEEAITVLDKARSIFEDSNNRQGLAETLHVLGMVASKSDPPQAVEYLTRSRDLYELLIGNNREMEIILRALDAQIEKLK
jgi:tetratricopeptide (TPR) repeat protein